MASLVAICWLVMMPMKVGCDDDYNGEDDWCY